MKIVVEVSEKDYQNFLAQYMADILDEKTPSHRAKIAIANGIPLPKGHGDLIDRSLLLEDMERAYRFANELVALGFAESFVEHAPTIIEADKEVAEE